MSSNGLGVVINVLMYLISYDFVCVCVFFVWCEGDRGTVLRNL